VFRCAQSNAVHEGVGRCAWRTWCVYVCDSNSVCITPIVCVWLKWCTWKLVWCAWRAFDYKGRWPYLPFLATKPLTYILAFWLLNHWLAQACSKPWCLWGCGGCAFDTLILVPLQVIRLAPLAGATMEVASPTQQRGKQNTKTQMHTHTHTHLWLLRSAGPWKSCGPTAACAGLLLHFICPLSIHIQFPANVSMWPLFLPTFKIHVPSALPCTLLHISTTACAFNSPLFLLTYETARTCAKCASSHHL